MQPRSLPGFRDFYPDDTALRNHIFTVWRDVAGRYGFEEYDGPPLEPLDLYTGKSGEEIVEQLYAFEDKGGRQVALRPEMTPTLARMVAARAQALKKPIRWYSIPQLFRYERQQRGRLREHFQLNMDLIGEPSPLADAEVIAAALDVMRAFGLGPDEVQVRISDRRVLRGLLERQGLSANAIMAALSQIDKIEREPRDALVARLSREAGLSEADARQALDVGTLKGMDTVRVALRDAGDSGGTGEGLEECVAALSAMGLEDFVAVDLSVVRGLAYYTGIVFELFDRAGSLRAICGGGRYDDLLQVLGGIDLPAVGFGMGDVVLVELLREHGLGLASHVGVTAFLVAVTGQDLPTVLRLAHQLRDAGLGVEFALKQQPVAKQLKLAAARSARLAVIVGPDERARDRALLRDLESGREERVAFDELVQYVGKREA